MKNIDKYIIFQFVKNFFFAVICFILIFILVDLFDNLDKFIDNRLGFGLVVTYYLYFIPEILSLIIPIAVLLSTLFTAGRMMNFNEIVAIKNAGVSLFRFMMPFLVCGVVITAFSLYFNNWTVPLANKKKFSFERNYLGINKPVQGGYNRLYFQDEKNRIILINIFNDVNLTCNNVSILIFNPDTLTNLVRRVDAEQMIWNNNNWTVLKAVDRRINITGGEEITKYDSNTVSDIPGIKKLNVLPEQIIKKQLKPDELNYSELNDFLDNQIKNGQNVDRLQVDFYSKISFPFSSFIVIIFGISISTGSKKRKGLALQFGISIMVSFIYLGFVKFSQTFGYNGDISPLLTAWIANIVFVLFGGINLFFKNY